MGSSCSTPFQYPSSGSTDCNSTRQAYGRPLACTLFQYPSSGSTDCNSVTVATSAPSRSAFQYPSSGSTDCNSRTRPGSAASPRPLSVSLKRIDGLQLHAPGVRPAAGVHALSVSLKRIDGLQRIPWDPARQPLVWLFQYPSSGSTDCNWPRSAPPPGRTPTLSVSLKRIDGLQPPGAQQQRVQPPELFQYPSSGSTDCNLLGVGWHAADLAASFSIPQADRRTATHRHPRPGPPRAVRFQYPSSGSTDCNAAVRRVERAAGHPPFSIPQADRRTATALAAAAADPCWFAFSIPQADRRTATGGS